MEKALLISNDAILGAGVPPSVWCENLEIATARYFYIEEPIDVKFVLGISNPTWWERLCSFVVSWFIKILTKKEK